MYHKSNNPGVVLALKNALEAKKNLIAESEKMVEKFGGKIVFSDDGYRCGVHGIKFDDFNVVENNHLWRKPTRSNGFACEPRSSIPKAADKKLLGKLRLDYYNLLPKSIDREEFFKSIGADWGHFMFTGLNYFLHGETVYFKTTATIQNVTEIFGSEYMRAEAAHNGKN